MELYSLVMPDFIHRVLLKVWVLIVWLLFCSDCSLVVLLYLVFLSFVNCLVFFVFFWQNLSFDLYHGGSMVIDFFLFCIYEVSSDLL